jgi:hypothetical protein
METLVSQLVDKLTNGTHPVEVSLRPERSAKVFKEACGRGYIHLKFTETHGGTELGVRLIPDFTDFSAADFDKASGQVKLAGDLVLDYVRVRCRAEIDVATLRGVGWNG